MKVPGKRLKVIALPIDNVARRHDDVRLDLTQLADDAVEKISSQHDAEVQIGYLRDGDAPGSELGCGDIDFFNLYPPRFDQSVAQCGAAVRSFEILTEREVSSPCCAGPCSRRQPVLGCASSSRPRRRRAPSWIPTSRAKPPTTRSG